MHMIWKYTFHGGSNMLIWDYKYVHVFQYSWLNLKFDIG
jgi:hypothetical protein